MFAALGMMGTIRGDQGHLAGGQSIFAAWTMRALGMMRPPSRRPSIFPTSLAHSRPAVSSRLR